MKILLSMLLIVIFMSCGGYNTGTVQQSEKGFLKFIGKTEQLRIVIDDGEAMISGKNDIVYQVKPGRHAVKVFRSEQLLVDRVIVVDNQATMEIEIP